VLQVGDEFQVPVMVQNDECGFLAGAKSETKIVDDPVVEKSQLEGQSGPSDKIFVSAELAFQLGFFNYRFIDDFRFRFCYGKKAAFIVLDHNRYLEFIANLENQEPETFKFIKGMLGANYQLVFDSKGYEIYARKTVSGKL